MGAIVIRTRFDEGTESAEVATSGVLSASDVFLSKNDNSGGETREVHSSQLRLIPYLHHTSPVRITIAPIGTTFGNLQ